MSNQSKGTIMSVAIHEFVYPERLDGAHRDAKCRECGLAQRTSVHQGQR